MSKKNKPDYKHWMSLQAWNLTHSYLLLHDWDPNDPYVKAEKWVISTKPEYKTRQKIIAARVAGDLIPCHKSKRSFRPLELLAWASDPERGIVIPEELFSLFEEKMKDQKMPIEETPHGNIEVHASKREEIFGAAIAVIARFPVEVGFKDGKLSGAKITKIIEQNSESFWPEDGAPPLSISVMEGHINVWINKLEPIPLSNKIPE